MSQADTYADYGKPPQLLIRHTDQCSLKACRFFGRHIKHGAERRKVFSGTSKHMWGCRSDDRKADSKERCGGKQVLGVAGATKKW